MNPLSAFGEDRRQMTGAIFTTFPFDAEFYERAIMYAVSKKGISSKSIVLTDAATYTETFDADTNAVTSAGVRYQLEPVSMDGRRVFHPKVYFFGGERRVYSYVGSANLTQKGFTDNAELWSTFQYEKNRDDEDPEQLRILRQIRDFLAQLLETKFAASVSDLSRSIITGDIFESCTWIDEIDTVDPEPQTHFLHNLDHSILSQVLDHIEYPITEATVVAPYFGETTSILQELASQDVETIDLYLQQNTAQIDTDALATWLDATDAGLLHIFTNPRFVHGKLLVLKTQDRSYCLTGSPNPSVQGMLKAARDGGNLEAGILREAPDPEHFEYLTADNADVEIIADIVGSTIEDFKPAPEPPLEDSVPDPSDPDIHLLDTLYNPETTLTGSQLTLTVAELNFNPDDAILVVSTPGGESFTLLVSEGDIESPEDTDEDLTKIHFEITGDDQQDILAETCKITIQTPDTTSQPRWLGHKTIEQKELVETGIKSGATTNVPDHVPEFLLGDQALQAEILHTVGQIITNLNRVDTDSTGGGGGGGRQLPPDWERTRSSMSKEPDEFVEELYGTWISEMEKLIKHVDDTVPKVLIQDFAKFIEAMNKATLHLLLIENKADRLGYDGETGFRHILRQQYRDVYGNGGSLVGNFIARLIRRELNRDDEPRLNAVYDGTLQYLFPQLVLTALIIEHEEDSDLQHHYYDWIEAAATNCFPDRHPMPRHLSSDITAMITKSIRATIDEILPIYSDEPGVCQYITHTYQDQNELRDQALKLYAQTLIAGGPSAIRKFYQGLHTRILNRDIDDIRRNASRCAGFLSSQLEQSSGTSSIVSTLEELQHDWNTVPAKYQGLLVYARPVSDN